MNSRQDHMSRVLLAVVAIGLVIGATGLIWYFSRTTNNTAKKEPIASKAPVTLQEPAEPTEFESYRGVKIIVTSPLTRQKVSSPMKVTGKVPGNWSFEATFPVLLLNSNGKTITKGYAQLDGDWMTEKPVAFTATLKYDNPSTLTGYLVLKNANASGMKENEDLITIPISFSDAKLLR